MEIKDMDFKLINTKNYLSKIKPTLFDDIGILTLFDEVYDHSWMDLQDVMEFLVDKDEILRRQAIFTDFLNDDKDNLRAFKRLCDVCLDSFKSYLSSDSDIKSYISIVIFYSRYVNFINEGSNILNELNFESNELNEMKKYFSEMKNDAKFINFGVEVDKCLASIQKMTKMVISFIHDEPYMYENTNETSEGVKTIEELLLSYADKLTIHPIMRESNYSRHIMDSYFYNRYEYVFSEDYSLIRKFFYNYSDECNYNFEILSNNLNYYLKFKMLFEEAKSNDVAFSKVTFNNEHYADFKNLSDITIMRHAHKITPNDCVWNEAEHVQIITGANGGGKTTYCRSIGANFVIMNSVGYCFATYACINPIKYLHTHFPNDENYVVGYGRLHDEIVRLDRIREDFCEDCLVLLNETFSSTDEDTALKESLKLLEEIDEKKVPLIFITHQQKLLDVIDRTKIALLNPVVDPENNNRRTFKIRRVGNVINSYAEDILRKYGLSRDQLMTRLEDLKASKEEKEGEVNEDK
ncbi:MAG: hypothetical protein IJS58_09965 [Bacilli bacterium]|nr:hypothetical protein [Bacilli bacterium]